MTDQIRRAPLADVTPDMSYGRLFNPFSSLTGGGDRYPMFMAKLFPGNPDMAWLVSKMGALALVGAGITGIVKSLAQDENMTQLKKYTDPDYKLGQQLSTTYSSNMLANGTQADSKFKKSRKQQKTAADTSTHEITDYTVAHPEATGAKTFFNFALPSVALLASAAMTYTAMDRLYDKRRNKELDKSLTRKQVDLNNLLQTRARLAKGVASDEEVLNALNTVNPSDFVVKTAGFRDWWEERYKKQDPHNTSRQINTALRLLSAGLTVSAIVGSYKYFKATDPAEIKFKAYKKALETYSKNRVANTPITILPADAKAYFDKINGVEEKDKETEKDNDVSNTEKELNPRSIPELQASNKPISITL